MQKNTIRTIILTAFIMLVFMFFLNVYDSSASISERMVMGLLCILYGVAPFYIRKNSSLGIDLDDKRNAVILSAAGLFLLLAIHSGIAYGLGSIEMLFAAVIGVAVFVSTIVLVRNSSITHPG